MPSADEPAILASADDEAARSILAEATWQQVHDIWERRTRLVLSPRSFGDRIVPVVEKHRAAQLQQGPQQMQRQPSADKAQRQLPPPPPPQLLAQQQPQPPHPARHALQAQTNGRYSSPPPAVNGATRPPPRPDSFEQQRLDINRIDSTLSSLQRGMSELTSTIQQLRHDVVSRSPRLRVVGDESNGVDLSDSATTISSKAGELDGLKGSLASLSRRIKLMEEANGTPHSPSLPDTSFPRPGSNSQFPPSQHAMPARPAEPRAWNAVNMGKRKSPSETDGYDLSPNGIPKRPRPLHANSSEKVMQLQQSAIPPPLPPSAPGQGPPTLAPIRSLSSQGQVSPPELSPWRAGPPPGPEPQRLPPLQGMPPSRGGVPPTQNGRPEGVEGPPPQHQQQPWGREQWEEGRPAPEYYRPIEGGIPGGDRRGSMIRRGTGGGLQYMDPNVPTKRTRQRPVRNADGILIRKDGKPDQRSISSPQNLRKVHARKMAEQEATRTGGSPLANDNGSQDGSSDGDSGMSSPREGEEQMHSHKEVMDKMFPHGIHEETGHGLSRRRAAMAGPEADGEEGSSNASKEGSRRSSTSADSRAMDIDQVEGVNGISAQQESSREVKEEASLAQQRAPEQEQEQAVAAATEQAAAVERTEGVDERKE